ncbi:MAG: tRNA 5-methoxyuridine(34)/uridine 5-oxyacetic acid(34) synthase CmoB, partial [Campylobacter ureolyticus]|nr:tRNA 5-methoxyuridine(34)/uridine 5-oxyacetic acid(34) synthase CmoB [Campylobacter ureolyticus]
MNLDEIRASKFKELDLKIYKNIWEKISNLNTDFDIKCKFEDIVDIEILDKKVNLDEILQIALTLKP